MFWGAMLIMMLVLQLIAFLVFVINPTTALARIQNTNRRDWIGQNITAVRVLLAIGAISQAIALAFVCCQPSPKAYEGPLSQPISA